VSNVDLPAGAMHASSKREARSGPGIFVAFIGPDGIGKTSVIRQVATCAERSFREIRYLHFRPPILAALSRNVPEGGAFIPKPTVHRLWNRPLSPLRLLRNVVRFRLGYRANVAPLLEQGGLVLADRYIYGYYYAPSDLKYYGPDWLVDSLLRFVVHPDLVFCLYADPAVVYARKPELSAEAIAAQVTRCRRFTEDDPRFVAIDADRPVAIIAEDVLRHIEAARERADRGGRPSAAPPAGTSAEARAPGQTR
jgi:thymidylate kinase